MIAISANPTGSAAARKAFEISSAGVVITRSSAAYSNANGSTTTRNSKGAISASASSNARRDGPADVTKAVMRMWPPLRNATTAPSIASQMNRIDASSSDQTSGA